jgi:HK97 family phage major capsid protein
MVEPVTGQPINTLSDLDKAICGAFFKWHLSKNHAGQPLPEAAKMTDHDRELMAFAINELPWSGEHTSPMLGQYNMSPEVVGRKLTDFDRKALGDETTSGGQYLSPAVWDQAIITIPYLNGQFFRRVTVVPIKGRRVEGAIMTQVNISSQAQDHTQDIPLETTANFAAAFNTSIHVANGAILVSNDLMADSPVNIGQKLTEEYGKALLTWLDEQIQVGDGTTEPQGVFNASSIVTVAGGGVAFTIAKYMDLIASVPYQYRQGVPAASRCVGGTDTSYWRARALAAGAGVAFGFGFGAAFEVFGVAAFVGSFG